MKSLRIVLSAAAVLSACACFAEDAVTPAAPPAAPAAGAAVARPARDAMRPMSPLVSALDANADGVIDADEIAKAAEALKALDKNGDGKLTVEELRPARPAGQPGAPRGQGMHRHQGEGTEGTATPK